MSSVSYCCYAIISIILAYIQYGVVINMQVVNSHVEFPAVTVCNLNPLDKRYSQSYIDRVLEKKNITYVANVSKS